MHKKIIHYLKYKENLSFNLLKKIKNDNPKFKEKELDKLEWAVYNYRFVLDAYFEGGGKILIIPQDKQLTDLEPFASFKGINFKMQISAPTEKGVTELLRNYDELRGLHTDNLTAFGVEDLLWTDSGIPTRTPIHEFGHVLETLIIRENKNLILELLNLFNAAKNRDVFLTNYSRVNHKEYFAEGVVAYLNKLSEPYHYQSRFGKIFKLKDKKLNKTYNQFINRSDLIKKDPALYVFILSAFKQIERIRK